MAFGEESAPSSVVTQGGPSTAPSSSSSWQAEKQTHKKQSANRVPHIFWTEYKNSIQAWQACLRTQCPCRMYYHKTCPQLSRSRPQDGLASASEAMRPFQHLPTLQRITGDPHQVPTDGCKFHAGGAWKYWSRQTLSKIWEVCIIWIIWIFLQVFEKNMFWSSLGFKAKLRTLSLSSVTFKALSRLPSAAAYAQTLRKAEIYWKLLEAKASYIRWDLSFF